MVFGCCVLSGSRYRGMWMAVSEGIFGQSQGSLALLSSHPIPNS